MNQSYWDGVAEDYDANIRSVFDHDPCGLVLREIEKCGSGVGKIAADLGCGVGKFIPMLAERFAEVEACDLSPRCLERAREQSLVHRNVRFHQLDFADEVAPFAPVDLVLCVNVLIMPSLDERLRAWRMVTNQVAQGGRFVLVVPAHESLLFSQLVAIESALDEGHDCGSAINLSLTADGSARDLQQGVHALESVRTKHYLKEEIEMLLASHHFDEVEVQKLSYPVEGDSTYGASRACTHDRVSPQWLWLASGRRR